MNRFKLFDQFISIKNLKYDILFKITMKVDLKVNDILLHLGFQSIKNKSLTYFEHLLIFIQEFYDHFLCQMSKEEYYYLSVPCFTNCPYSQSLQSRRNRMK